MDYYNFNNNNSDSLQTHIPSNFVHCSQYDFGYNYDHMQLSLPNNYNLEANHQHVANTNNSNAFMKIIDVNIKTDDELWVETWLSKIGKIHINLDSIEEIKPLKREQKDKIHSVLQIHKAKYYLKHCFHIMQKLQKTYENLQNDVSTMSSSEWKRKTIEIGALKDEFSSIMANFDNSTIVKMLRKSVETRQKKRRRQKQRKIQHKENIQRLKEDREKMHNNIDQWLLNMKDNAERAKMVSSSLN